ncbi:type II toxin-antitoxin system Phd/YefM family antitoxin [Thiomicrospira microaerophila]|uniref:type II toxin-antitoxin system Phd/YefM family antitoxin n=1 Tax=Thiomicrospira microaerophila TaxID=406020 RepID=UPI0005C8EF49|nr:type II toxin-antitoxin system Phd/YefM family antitoxin [Thiomicrospira microaerophila]
MTTLNSSEARSHFYGLLAQVNDSHQPVTITGKNGNAVLISESDWQAINETLYLLNIPGMRESIIEGMNTPLDACHEQLDW